MFQSVFLTCVHLKKKIAGHNSLLFPCSMARTLYKWGNHCWGGVIDLRVLPFSFLFVCHSCHCCRSCDIRTSPLTLYFLNMPHLDALGKCCNKFHKTLPKSYNKVWLPLQTDKNSQVTILIMCFHKPLYVQEQDTRWPIREQGPYSTFTVL